jgi:hypothetical protein
MAGIAAGPTDDVVVADRSGGTVFEQHRWNVTGMGLGVHQDAMGSYAGPFWTTKNLIIDAGNDLFYGLLMTGMVQGTNSASKLLFNRISPAGQVVFSDPASGTMPTGNPAPSVQFFFAGRDSGGGLHAPLLMGNPAVFAPGVYCYGPSGNNNGVSAASLIATLSSTDTVLGAPDAGLFVAHPLAASTTDACGTINVPAGGALEIMRTNVGGNCVWHKGLSVPTAAVKALSFHLGADGSLTLAVVYSGTIDLGKGPFASTGSSSLAMARWTAAGALVWANSFGGAGSIVTLGSVDSNINGITIVTGGYAGGASFGGATLPASNDTFLTVLDATGNLRWDKPVTVGSSGALIAASAPCGLALATNSTAVNLGAGPLSTVTAPSPPTIGVAAIAF